MESVAWTDVETDESGVATGVLGKSWRSFTSKQLRLVCSLLSVRGVKNARKSVMEDVLVEYHKNKQMYASLRDSDGHGVAAEPVPKKEPQCSFFGFAMYFSAINSPIALLPWVMFLVGMSWIRVWLPMMRVVLGERSRGFCCR